MNVIGENMVKKPLMDGLVEAESIEHVIVRLAEDLSIDGEIIQELVSDFIERLPPISDTLLANVMCRDSDSTRGILHQIAGASGNMRFSSVYDMTNLISEAVGSGDWEKAQFLTNELSQYAAWLMQEQERRNGKKTEDLTNLISR